MSIERGNIILFISRRFQNSSGRTRSKTAFYIGLTGVTLAVMTVLLTLSVLKGFDNELKKKLFLFNSSITIYPLPHSSRDSNKSDTPENIINLIRDKYPDLPISEEYTVITLLKSNDNFDNIILRDYGNSVNELFSNSFICNLDSLMLDSPNSILISQYTSNILNVHAGDKLDAVIPIGNGMKLRRLEIAGIYDTGFTDFDEHIAYAQKEMLLSVLGRDADMACTFKIKTINKSQEHITELSQNLSSYLNSLYISAKINLQYGVTTIYDEQAIYFSWLSLLNTNSIVISILMFFIAAFTLIGAIIIIIMEKISSTGILKTLGCTNNQIMKIFRIIGMRMILLSLFISNVSTIIIIFVQNTWHIMKLNAQDYYLSGVPMSMDFLNLLVVDLAALFLGWLSLQLLTLIVRTISPAKIIRFN